MRGLIYQNLVYKKILSLESIFHPELPSPTNTNRVRDGEGDGSGGSKFKSTHYRPDSAQGFPYLETHEGKQDIEDIKDMLNLESFTVGAVPRKSMDPAMSLRRLSYSGGQSQNYGNSSRQFTNFQTNANDESSKDDGVVPFSLTGHFDFEKEEEELLELRNARAMATQDGNPMITTKSGWVNGMPRSENEPDVDIEKELGLLEYADTSWTKMSSKNSGDPKGDYKFFDEIDLEKLKMVKNGKKKKTNKR
jgi:hypothetical protein